jgi:glycosyltransferase involved in cell wall biosynthesis
MRKLICIFLPNLRGGGAERSAVNLSNNLIQRGYAVDIVLLSATGDFMIDLHPSIRVVDLQVERMRWALPALVSYLRRSKPAAILACMWPLTLIAIWARTLSRVPTRLVVAEHTTWSRSKLLERWSLSWQVRTSMKFFYSSADAIVTVSKGAADDLASFASLDRKYITVIYNPVVGDAKPPSNAPIVPAGWCAGPHYKVLAVGNLKSIKNYATLIQAFAYLCQRVDARLLILGEGELRSVLEAQTRQLGIDNKVFIYGFVKDVSPYYQHADLHVLSSDGEGLPTVIIEALAVGTPVVSTDCPSGPREILCDGQFGRLVPVGDAHLLALAMGDSLAATHDTGALKSRAQDFSIGKAVDRYLELLFPKKSSGAHR